MKKLFRIAGILAVTGIVAAIFVYFFVYNKPHRDYEKANADIEIQAEELFREYTDNKISADEKFTGKVVKINGTLSNIEQQGGLVIIVFAFSEGMSGEEGIRCTVLHDYNEKALSLSENSDISIKGYCTGYNDTDVILEKCSF